MFMNELSIFKNINSEVVDSFLKELGARRISFEKDHIIFSNLADNDLIGIMLNGVANIIKYDYLGNRDILDVLEYGDVFSKPFFGTSNDISIIAKTDSEVLFIDYSLLASNNREYEKINVNINDILALKINKLYEKLEILSKRTIKEKLLCYFSIMVKKRGQKSFNIPMTYMELADYLSVDRSAMMREIKKLKDQKIISVNDKKITFNN